MIGASCLHSFSHEWGCILIGNQRLNLPHLGSANHQKQERAKKDCAANRAVCCMCKGRAGSTLFAMKAFDEDMYICAECAEKHGTFLVANGAMIAGHRE